MSRLRNGSARGSQRRNSQAGSGVRQSTFSVLAYLHRNVTDGRDSLDDARRFVKKLDLPEAERCLLDCALTERRQLREFHVGLAVQTLVR